MLFITGRARRAITPSESPASLQLCYLQALLELGAARLDCGFSDSDGYRPPVLEVGRPRIKGFVGIFKRKRSEAVTPEVRVYYSTPFGDTNDGQQKLFLLERDGVRYMPVFRSVDSMKQFYALKNRAAYMILEGDIDDLMDMNRSIELMKTVGVVIEPMSEHPVEIMPDTDGS